MAAPTAALAQPTDPATQAQIEIDLEAVINANTEPANLAAQLADFLAARCLGGDCKVAVSAALNLASALPATSGAPNPISSAIGSALAQVARATSQIRPEIAASITSQIDSPPPGATDVITSFNAVMALATPDTVATATIGTPASGG